MLAYAMQYGVRSVTPFLIKSNPAELYSEVAPDDRSKRLVRADLTCTGESQHIEFGVSAIFERYVLAQNGIAEDQAYCIATRGGEISLDVPSCELREHCGGEALLMNVEKSEASGEQKQSNLAPELEGKAATISLKGKVGSRTKGSEKNETTKVSYSVYEQTIAIRSHRTGLSWTFKKPHNDQAPMNYLLGSHFLSAIFDHPGVDTNGTLRVSSSGYAVFDGAGRQYSKGFFIKSLILALREGVKLKELVAPYDIEISLSAAP